MYSIVIKKSYLKYIVIEIYIYNDNRIFEIYSQGFFFNFPIHLHLPKFSNSLAPPLTSNPGSSLGMKYVNRLISKKQCDDDGSDTLVSFGLCVTFRMNKLWHFMIHIVCVHHSSFKLPQSLALVQAAGQHRVDGESLPGGEPQNKLPASSTCCHGLHPGASKSRWSAHCPNTWSTECIWM